MEAAFVILLDSALYNYTRNLQTKLYELYQTKETLTLEPHITIKYAFKVTDLLSIESYFEEIAQHTKPFMIEVNGINSFDPNKVVFLAITKNQTIKNLHIKILFDLNQKFSIKPSAFEGESANFHITLVYKDISESTFQKIKEYFINEKPRFIYEVSKLGLYLKLEEQTNWFVYKVGVLK